MFSVSFSAGNKLPAVLSASDYKRVREAVQTSAGDVNVYKMRTPESKVGHFNHLGRLWLSSNSSSAAMRLLAGNPAQPSVSTRRTLIVEIPFNHSGLSFRNFACHVRVRPSRNPRGKAVISSFDIFQPPIGGLIRDTDPPPSQPARSFMYPGHELGALLQNSVRILLREYVKQLDWPHPIS